MCVYLAWPQVLTADELLHVGTDGPENGSLNQLGRAKFDFTGKSEKELSFRKVVPVRITRKNTFSDSVLVSLYGHVSTCPP